MNEKIEIQMIESKISLNNISDFQDETQSLLKNNLTNENFTPIKKTKARSTSEIKNSIKKNCVTPPINKFSTPINSSIYKNQVEVLEKQINGILKESDKINNILFEKLNENYKYKENQYFTSDKNFLTKNSEILDKQMEKIVSENERLLQMNSIKNNEIMILKEIYLKSDNLIAENENLINEVNFWKKKYFEIQNILEDFNNLNPIIKQKLKYENISNSVVSEESNLHSKRDLKENNIDQKAEREFHNEEKNLQNFKLLENEIENLKEINYKYNIKCNKLIEENEILNQVFGKKLNDIEKLYQNIIIELENKISMKQTKNDSNEEILILNELEYKIELLTKENDKLSGKIVKKSEEINFWKKKFNEQNNLLT